ncbi:IPT/TIG domain-containing protein [Psychrobacillus sp. FSL K6-2365]|uniref:IPT/TIG domain-containing protein n=1 Tax=Psychrobacillus sp. FSL K6-2365 TaxID=2921546 RepID=UPI0030F584E5
MKFFKSLKLFLIAILIIGIAIPLSTEAATVNSGDLMKINKTVSNNTLVNGETTDVTLTVKGTPQDSTFVKPNDVVLIIDKSGSMQADNRLNAAKDAAKEFIDLMDLTKHELGIVDYSDRASSFPLTTDKTAAKAYVDTIQLGGGTNTSDAIRTATTMLANKRATAQPTIVIMTDGAANSAPDALTAAKAAKDAGITFYSIALLGPNENPNTSAPNNLLKEMASSFDHHHFVLGSVGLSDVYKAIVEEIGLASAYNVTITDTISPEFELVPGSYDHHIPKPTVTGNKIEWFISELKTNELIFTYQVRAKADATAGKYAVAQTSSTFEIGDGSTYSLNTTNPIVEIKNHAPIITSIIEDKGLTTGGETVTITGQHFQPGVKVYFGTKLATIISEKDTEIVVTTPTGSQGSVVVKVENPDRQTATGNFLYYAYPTITSVTPAEGPLKGGNSIAINGTDFLYGATVYINNVEANTSFVKNSTLRATVPAAILEGSVTVKVVNPDLTSVELVDGYTYLAPPPNPAVELISLSAISGKIDGGNSILLNGKNFDRNVKAYFGSQEAVITSYVSSLSIRVTVPAGATAGLVSVKVVNPDNSTAELVDAYEYVTPPPLPAPEIDALSENTGQTGQTKLISITGKNFAPSTKVFFGNQEVVTAYRSKTALNVRYPVSDVAGAVDILVRNEDGQDAVLTNGFTYIASAVVPSPIITSLSSNVGSITGNETITITGQNFQPSATVYFNNKGARVLSISDTEIKVVTPVSTVTGLVSVKVVNPDLQEVVLLDSFLYEGLKPTITSLSQVSGAAKGNYLVNIIGTNFTRDMTITVDGKTIPFTFFTNIKVQIRMPAGTPGVVDIILNNNGATATTQFTYY